MSKRAVIRLEMDVVIKSQLDQLCDKRGMTQIAVLSRLVKRFGRQDEFVQAAVLELLSQNMLGGDIGEVIRKRLSAAAKSASSGGVPAGAK